MSRRFMRSSIGYDAKLEKSGALSFCACYWYISRAMLWGTCLWDIWALEERHKEVIMVNNGSCWLGQGIYSDNNTALRCQTAQVFSSKQFRSNNCFHFHSLLFSFLSPPLNLFYMNRFYSVLLWFVVWILRGVWFMIMDCDVRDTGKCFWY